jgi:hypothetical protein
MLFALIDDQGPYTFDSSKHYSVFKGLPPTG